MTNVSSVPAADNDGRSRDSSPPATPRSQPLLAHALQSVVAQLHDQIALIAGQQADLMVQPIRTAWELQLDQALDAVRRGVSRSVDDGLEPVRSVMRQHVDEMLAPVQAVLQSRVDETLAPLLYARPGEELGEELRSPTKRHRAWPRRAGAAAKSSTDTSGEDGKPRRTSRSVGHRTRATHGAAGSVSAAETPEAQKPAPRRSRRSNPKEATSQGESAATSYSRGTRSASRSTASAPETAQQAGRKKTRTSSTKSSASGSTSDATRSTGEATTRPESGRDRTSSSSRTSRSNAKRTTSPRSGTA